MGNNDSHGDEDALRSFNVSFISRYPSEDERLFIGGFYRIRVQSIKLLKTKQNFAQFIAPLYYLDCMVTAKSFDPVWGETKPGKNAKGIIDHLFKYKLAQKPELKMDSYLYETFDGYTRNKEHIQIYLDDLSKAKQSMRKLIIHSIEEGKKFFRADNDKTNLLKNDICAIFPNIKTVYIAAGFYSFSLIGFLSVLQASEWQNVTIRGWWMSKLWQSSKRALIDKEYQSNDYQIEYENHQICI